MNITPAIGFIGFGEAAYHLARGLREAGIKTISAYDIHQDMPGRSGLIRQRAEETATHLEASNASLASISDIIFSTVTANQASAAADQTAPHLQTRHLYADLNSVSPGLKKSIAAKINSRGARFVEVAVMAPVPPYGHSVPMLTGGLAAAEFAERLAPFGMQIEVGVAEVGTAAATKMCRSIMIKGIEALITECVMTATHYGVDEDVLASLSKTFPGTDWQKVASYLVSRVTVHGERRAREMDEAVVTVKEAGVAPIMTAATVQLMDWSANLGLREVFGGKGPADYREFAATLAAMQKTPH